MGRHRAAFTLLELIIGMLIVGLLIAIGMANMRRGLSGAQSQGLAQVVAEELRLARQTAMARQIPVAVAFPSNGGTVPHAQSLYNLAGEIRPKMTRVANYQGDFPQAFIFSSIWPLAAGSLTTAAPTPQTNQDDPPPWPASPDPMLIFTPAGTVLSNGMARFGENYHVLVSQGIDYGATGPPPGGSTLNFFAATQVSAPYTITVTPLGSVSVTGGVLNNGGVVDVPAGAGPGPAPVAPAPVLAAVVNAPPVIDRITVQAAPATLAAGSDALVADNETVSLRVEALDTDPDDPLDCQWATVPPGLGRFSSASFERMEWDPQAGVAGTGAWVSVWEWTPPIGEAIGTPYNLAVTVRDRENGAVTGTATANREAERSSPDELVYSVDDRGDQNYDLVACNVAGDGFRYLARTAANETAPVPSPDGARVAYVYQDDSSLATSFYHLRHANGMGDRALTGDIGSTAPGCRPMGWSPNSSELVCMMFVGGSWDLQLVPLDGTAPVALANDPVVGERCPTFNPMNPDQMAYLRDDNTLWVWDRPGPATQVTLQDAGGLPVIPLGTGNLAWSPDGAQLAFSGSATAGAPEIWSAAVTPGPGPYTWPCTMISATPARGDLNPAWSPPGTPLRLAYHSAAGIFVRDLALGPELTLSGAAGDVLPGWAGEFVYFFRTGGGLCRVPAGGGPVAGLTRGTRPVAHEVAPRSLRSH